MIACTIIYGRKWSVYDLKPVSTYDLKPVYDYHIWFGRHMIPYMVTKSHGMPDINSNSLLPAPAVGTAKNGRTSFNPGLNDWIEGGYSSHAIFTAYLN